MSAKMEVQQENARKTEKEKESAPWSSPAFDIAGPNKVYDSRATSKQNGHGASTQPAQNLKA